jgi:hypothetical protein
VKAADILKGTAGQLMILIFLQTRNSVSEKVRRLTGDRELQY